MPALAQEPPLDSLGGRIVHVYMPNDGIEDLIVRNWSIPMTKTGKYWYTATLKGDRYNSNQGFFFANQRSDQFISVEGLAATERTKFYVADFEGKQEMWIVIDPSGPTTAKPVVLLEPPKIVNILNPWETTGPRLVTSAGKKSMVTVDGMCGWFMAFLLKPAELLLHFEEVNGMATYGSRGLGTTDNYAMATEFTSKGVPGTFGTQLWLDTDLNTWFPTDNKKIGTCQYMMAATVRDFSGGHPDFDFASIKDDWSAPGMVNKAISVVGGERRPARSAVSGVVKGLNIFNDFASWWKTDETNATVANRSYETCVDIPMDKTGDGLWEYDSYKTPAHGFWPVENFTNPNNVKEVAGCYNNPSKPDQWTNETVKRNMNYCMESHAKFVYQPGQKFVFRGDDDVWVFINDQLVIDLGGIHIPKSDSVDLDKLGLQTGKEYNWDLFYCERQPCGSSLRIKTSIFFRQQKSLFIEETSGGPGTVSVKIRKRVGGKGSCAGLGDTTTQVVDPALLTYKLLDASGTEVSVLANGDVNRYGGITIATPDVKVDTSKITGLTPGDYRIIAFEPANEKLQVEIPFKVPFRNMVEYMPGQNDTVPLGTLVRVILVNRDQQTKLVVPKADKYVPSYPGGLDVYVDSLKSRIATVDDFTTDATGYDTIWVTDTAFAVANKSYTLTMLPVTATTPSVTITFLVPKVAFQPLVPNEFRLGTLVPVVAVNTVPTVPGRYKLEIPLGLEVYQTANRSEQVNGNTVLSTDPAGFDTLWVTGVPTLADAEYTLKIVGSNSVTLKFLVPKNRVEFNPQPGFAKEGPMNSLIQITARNMENGLPRDSIGKYVLNIPLGLEVYTNSLKTQRVNLNPAIPDTLLTALDGWDTLWVTADSTVNNLETKEFFLKITTSPQEMKLTFTMPELVLPQATFASMHDVNGDGIPDSLVVTYNSDIAVQPPTTASYRWPSSAVAVPIADIRGKAAGNTLTVRGPLTTVIATSGEGTYTSVYLARNRENTQNLTIFDKMGPVLLKAEITLGQTQDTLRLKFSEPIQVSLSNGAAPATLFGYKLLPDADPIAFTPISVSWSSDATEATLLFLNTETAIPKAGNLVRINDGPGLIADAKGNTAGPASRFRIITGLKRAEIRTVTYKEIEPTQVLLLEPPVVPSLHPITAEVKDVVASTGRMGHLIKTDLGDFATGDDFTPVDPAKVSLEYNVFYYTNHGVPVASQRRVLLCNDQEVYKGDCLKNRGFLFVGWNYTSLKGAAKVGTGAYISRIRYTVRVSGQVRENGGLDQTWGVLRR